MTSRLLTAAVAALLSGMACAAPDAAQDADKAAYDKALSAYSCVDYDRAFRLFSEAAKTGYSQSEYMLGVMLSAGQGHEEDDKAAFDWFMRSARQGLADAQYALGDMYQKGEGVAKDDSQALFWFELAFRGGYKLAKDNVEAIMPHLNADQLEQVQKRLADWLAQPGR
ncbi:tetratricopeptide repeat protein [Parasulfuritortus cantonensis]|nr:tetratricopeptide repeat protein [Parasulfuritortus cantonensis]